MPLHTTPNTTPQQCHSHINAHVEEVIGGQMRRTYLQPVDVHIDHGVAEVGLDVCHRLALDLESVAHPYTRQDLVEQRLRDKRSF